MLGVLDATSRNDTVQLLLDSPDLAATAKAYRLAEVCGDELDDRGKKFLQALAEHDRLALIPESILSLKPCGPKSRRASTWK